MNKFLIGIVYSPQIDVLQWYTRLSAIGEVRLLMPQERSARYDVILLPDAGVNTNMNTFKTKSIVALGSRPICPALEMFRIESLDYYIENNIPVIGIGDSRAVIYNNIEGAKTVLIKDRICLLHNEIVQPLEEESDFEMKNFAHNDIYGIESIETPLLLNILKQIKYKVTNEEQADNTGVSVSSPNKPSPPAISEEEELPEEEDDGLGW